MNSDLYTYIGYVFVASIKYIFLPIGVATIAKVFAEKLLKPQPKRQRKKRSKKTV